MSKTTWMWVALGMSTLTFSCTYKAEREQLKQQAAELEQRLHERDSAFNGIMAVMTEVENSIALIKEQENLINTSTGDMAADQTLAADVNRLGALITSANEKVASLSSQLDKSKVEMKAFRSKLQLLTKDLQDRENSLIALREELNIKNEQIATLDTEVKTLVDRVQVQTETIEVQTQELAERETKLNTAYFTIDTDKNLVAKGLVSKEGGFLGLGKTTTLQADASKGFTEVNIRDTKKFYIDSEKMKLVTEHPSSSYKLVQEDAKVKYLEVTNPDEFWKISKYLVVSIK